MTRTFVRRAVLGAALATAVATSACSSGGSAASTAATSTATTTSTATATKTATTTTTRTSTASPGTSSPGPATDARNLAVSQSVRAGLVAAFVRGQRLGAADVAGTKPGSTYYGYVRSSGMYWAVADFTPSPVAVHRSRTAKNGGPLVQFQDGPWAFVRRPHEAWKLVTDTGGHVCPNTVPAAMLAVWDLSTTGC